MKRDLHSPDEYGSAMKRAYQRQYGKVPSPAAPKIGLNNVNLPQIQFDRPNPSLSGDMRRIPHAARRMFGGLSPTRKLK